ncbi:MAG: hypothetical protein RJB01_610 [Actinomycetota bacterium]|jgi:Arc/MetJ-type ribon-helix-helix transcriptional regulator
MSIQIAVRLPDHMVHELDALVASGEAPSRASVVEAALRGELRQHAYAREVALRATQPPDDEFDPMHKWAQSNFTTDD